MNIYARPGSKVVFAHPTNGYQIDRDAAGNHLTVGATYTVEHIEVGNWSTGVYLREVPGVSFNSVLFDDAQETNQ